MRKNNTLPKTTLLLAILLAAPATAQTLYVTNQQAGIITLNAVTLEQTGTIDPGGKGPRGLAITQDGTLLVTANQATGDLSVITRATGALKTRIPIGPSVEMVRTSGHTAYVTYEPSQKEDAAAHIAIVDLDAARVIGNITTGQQTEGLEFSPDGKFLLVANEGDNTVSVYNLPGGTVAHVVKTGAYGTRPRGIKQIPGGGYLVSLEVSDNLLVLDKDFNPDRTVPTAGSPYGMAFSPDGAHLFVAAASAGLLQVFDTKTYAHITDIPIGKRCWHFSFTPDARHIVAACGRSGDLRIIDAATLSPVRAITGVGMPWGVVAYPAASGSLQTP